MLPEKFNPTPAERASAETELFVSKIDRIMSEETLILDGLQAAVHGGRITEDEKQEFLNEYISKRNGNGS